MGSDMTVSISLIISLISVVILLINFFTSRKKDNNADTENRIKVNIKLDNLCGDVRDIKESQKETIKEQNKIIKDLTERLVVIERDEKTLFVRYDSLAQRLEEIENRR